MFDLRSMTQGLLALGLAATLGCDSNDGDGPSQPGLAIHLYGASGAADPFSGVGWMKIIMTGDGLQLPFTLTVPYAPGGAGTLDGVPFSGAGQKRQLVIEGWSDAGGQPGFALSRGRAPALEVQAGAPEQEVDVLFARVNSFLPLISTTTKAPQQLAVGRVGHTATLTAREVVVTGGGTISNAASTWWNGTGFQGLTTSVEAIDLDTRQVATRTPLLLARTWHTATALSSGQIILAGGYGANGVPSDTAELYNPPDILEGRAVALPRLGAARAAHTATLIDEATRVILFIGGDDQGTWELWDPVNGSHGVHPMPDNLPRRHHQATTFFIPGRTEPAVLITGGETPNLALASAMLYDSVAEALVGLAGGQAMPGGARTQHTAIYVPNRNFIYVAGGFTDVQRKAVSATIDVFDINQTRFLDNNAGFRMRTARGGHQAVLLADNLVCMAGGVGDEPLGTGIRPLGSLEVIYEYLEAGSPTLHIEIASSWNPNGVGGLPYLPSDRVGHRLLALDGLGLVVGGASIDQATSGFKMAKELTLYSPQ
jgi:hypothetical protein